MKKFVFIFVLFWSVSIAVLQSQEFGSNIINIEKTENNAISPTFKPDVSVTLGTSFTSFGQGFTTLGTYIMPEVTVPISKKFSVRAGIGYTNMFLSTPENTGSIFTQNNFQYGTVYVSGLYNINSKLTIAGAAFKTFDLAPKSNELNPHALDFSNEGIMINVDYKVSDHFRINAEFSYQKQNPYNYYFNPVGFNMHSNLFHNTGFDSGFGPGF